MILESRGQISAEYLLLLVSLIVILMISISFIASQNELTMAMAAARSGVNEGSLYASCAIYPSDTFNDYSKKGYEILIPSSVEIVNISYTDMGHDPNFDKQKICSDEALSQSAFSATLPYNLGIMKYKGGFYPLLMPCGEISSQSIDEDDKDIF